MQGFRVGFQVQGLGYEDDPDVVEHDWQEVTLRRLCAMC